MEGENGGPATIPAAPTGPIMGRDQTPVHAGRLEVRPADHAALVDGRPLVLTVRELQLLTELAHNAERVMTREELYALQPYLLELYGDPHAYQVAGLAAAILAAAPHLGGIAAPRIRGLFRRRTSALLLMAAASAVTLVLIGSIQSFWPVIGLTTVWGLLFAATMPIRQTYINGMIPSKQRATILSFDSMMSSSGGVWTQPVLGKAADAYGYGTSYVISAGIATLPNPVLALSRRQDNPPDPLEVTEAEAVPQPA